MGVEPQCQRRHGLRTVWFTRIQKSMSQMIDEWGRLSLDLLQFGLSFTLQDSVHFERYSICWQLWHSNAWCLWRAPISIYAFRRLPPRRVWTLGGLQSLRSVWELCGLRGVSMPYDTFKKKKYLFENCAIYIGTQTWISDVDWQYQFESCAIYEGG